MDLKSYSPEELALVLPNLSLEELVAVAPKLNEEQLIQAISGLDQNKTLAVVKALKDTRLLETAGKHLSLDQVCQILSDYPNWTNGDRLKLPPLMVGIPQGLFIELLRKGGEIHLNVLREESITEPIQHHLNLLIHEMEKENSQMFDHLSFLEGRVEQLDVKESTKEDLRELQETIDTLGNNLKRSLHILKSALAIAWKAGRPDLIQRLNTLNINVQRVESESIDFLNANLKQMLHNVFGNPLDVKDQEALSDNDPAVEGLVKFSVWYLQDYWEVGLLPKFSNPMDVTLEDRHVSDRAFHEHRQAVFQEVQENLAKMGLQTVRDLKDVGIFSRKTLEDYIASHQNLLG